MGKIVDDAGHKMYWIPYIRSQLNLGTKTLYYSIDNKLILSEVLRIILTKTFFKLLDA